MTGTVRTRRAEVTDTDAVARLEADLFGAEAWSVAQVHEELTGPGRRAWLAGTTEAGEDGEAAVGYAITLTRGEVADLQRIAVSPTRRRTGVARALLDEALAAARADGADRVLLEVSSANTAAMSFYAAAGFTAIDTRPHYYRDGSDAMVLRRSLARGCSWG